VLNQRVLEATGLAGQAAIHRTGWRPLSSRICREAAANGPQLVFWVLWTVAYT